ncbi:MAG: putative ABC transporter ATP-binding protein [Firmicutes bacterium ADurb.Bin248]|nr:MAG: putative ABC transporter ATP-binding protein [Firmicutes bacterium ADurb.Bin248]
MADNAIRTEIKVPSIGDRLALNALAGVENENSTIENAKGTFRRILRIFLRWGRTVFAAMLLTATASGVQVAVPYFTGKAFNTFALRGFAFDEGTLLLILLAVAALHATRYVTTTLSDVLMLRVSQKLIHVIRGEFFKKMQRLPLGFFDTTSHGDTMSRLANDVDSISSTISSSTTQLIASALTLFGSLTLMIVLDWRLTLVVLVAVPLVYALTRLIATKSRAYFLAQQQSLGALNGVIEENILGMKMVKAFSRQEEAKRNFSEINESLYRSSYRAQTWAGFMMPLMNVINNLTFTLTAIAGGVMSVSYGLAIGTVVSFLSYSKQFAQPLNNIASLFNSIQQALAGAERVFEILDRAEETPDTPDAVALTSPKGGVSFENVCFSYDKQRPVLQDVSFDVRPGEVVALVGETGSGKTTIVNLVTRFYDADSGVIRIDGVDIRGIRRESLRACFSVVLQDTCLFSGTVMDNIRYSKPEATDAQVVEAARLARADDFIRKLPEGYATMVSGSADNLSQGQRQLLAIARAALCESPILILDEATSSVDTKTEKDIQLSLLRLMSSRTSFLIAHRLSTIRDADRIMVLHEGKIVERGDHASLMAAKGRYYDMVVSQMGLSAAEE